MTFVRRAALTLLCASIATAPAGGAPWAGVAVLMYHRVDREVPRDAVGRDLTVDPETFEAQLRWLQAHHVRTLTATELRAGLARGTRPENAVVLTFDDGYAEAATTVFPLLQRYGARATFFVSSGFVGTPNHLSWRQMRAMRAAGDEIACHGTEHLDLTQLDRTGQLREAGHCVASFRRYLAGWEPQSYAYPAGKYDASAIAVLQGLGFNCAFTERPGSVQSLERPFELPRRRVSRDDGLGAFSALALP